MTEQTPTLPPRRYRWLLFLLPVLAVHALLLAGLPYWQPDPPTGVATVNIELAPLTAPASVTEPAPGPPTDEQTSPSPPRAARPTPSPAPPTPAAADAEPSTPPARQKTPSPARPQPDNVTAAPATEPPPATKPATTQAPAAPSPATAPPTATSAPDWRIRYTQALRDALAAHHRYPSRAKRFGLTGTVRVAFTIQRDGRFADIHVARSAETPMLDQAALDTVRSLGRFQPLPPTYSGDGWAVSVPLVYRLD